MTISVRADPDNRRAYVRISTLEARSSKGLREGWFKLAKGLKSEANKEILRRPKGGRTYIRRDKAGRRRRHVASAPGETHANMTGKLRRSLSWKVTGHTEMEFGYGVSTTASNVMPFYGKFVEFGTKKMDERPSLKNAIRVENSKGEQLFIDALDRGFR